jgi:hypothetical protein
MMLGALARMLSVLDPELDWVPLARVYNHSGKPRRPSATSWPGWFPHPICSSSGSN